MVNCRKPTNTRLGAVLVDERSKAVCWRSGRRRRPQSGPKRSFGFEKINRGFGDGSQDSCVRRSVRVDRRQWGASVAPYFLQCILGVAADGTLALHGH